MILLSPGPVHIDPSRYSSIRPMHHRTEEFREILGETADMTAALCGTRSKPCFLAASGTGAMECALGSVVEEGDSVLVPVAGKFGRRWAEIARARRCHVEVIEFEPGVSIDPGAIADRVERAGPRVLALTHVESSTGLILDLRSMMSETRRDGMLVLVDAIASVGSEMLAMDDWGIDLLVGAGQKALCAPAGISFVIAGGRAARIARKVSGDMYYLSLARYLDAASTGDTPFTPAVDAVQILHGSLRTIFETGVDEVLERHAAAGGGILDAAAQLGLRVLPEKPSFSVQAFLPPEGVDAGSLIDRLRKEHSITVAGGQGSLAGRIFRTGFPGIHSREVLVRLVEALYDCLRDKVPATGEMAALDRISRFPYNGPLFDSHLT